MENSVSDQGQTYQEIQQELLNSRAQLRQVIDLIPEFIYARDYEGRFLLVNELAARYMDRTPSELEGKYYEKLDINNETKESHLEEDKRVMDNNIPLEIPLEKFTFSDNSTKYVRTYKVPFVMNSTHTKGVLCISYDVTRFINVDHLKDEYITQLEELAFTTSHIVRQPLTSVLGLIHLLEDDSISKEELMDLLSNFKEQITRMDNFTRELSSTIQKFRQRIDNFPQQSAN